MKSQRGDGSLLDIHRFAGQYDPGDPDKPIVILEWRLFDDFLREDVPSRAEV